MKALQDSFVEQIEKKCRAIDSFSKGLDDYINSLKGSSPQKEIINGGEIIAKPLMPVVIPQSVQKKPELKIATSKILVFFAKVRDL